MQVKGTIMLTNEIDTRIESARICHESKLEFIEKYSKFDESKHPRGKPENAGEFTSGSSGSSAKPESGPVDSKPDWFKGKAKQPAENIPNGGTPLPPVPGKSPASPEKPKKATYQFHPEELEKMKKQWAAKTSQVNTPEQQAAADALAKQDKMTPAEMAEKHGEWNASNNPTWGKGGAADQKKATEESAKAAFFNPDEMKIPKEAASQPVAPNAGYKPLAQKGNEGNFELQEFLDFGRGIGAQLGYKTIEPGQYSKEEIDQMLNQPGGMVMLSPVKGEKRSTEKVMSDYGGDWSKLLDIARATVAVDSVEEVHQVIEKMRRNGVKWARQPKDRMNHPPDQTGYRDILTNIVMPNGIVAELQIHLKPMLIAKNQGHKQYEQMRTIESRCKAENRPRNPQEEAEYNQALKESQKIYGDAWAKSVASTDSSPASKIPEKA